MNQPFEGDTYIKNEIIKLKEKFDLKTCIETGTQYGSTTKELASIFNRVISIEADPEYLAIAKTNATEKNITFIEGKSQGKLLELRNTDNVFYYLDAHGCNVGGCPLKQELGIIADKYHKNVVIAIHDFKVPDKPDFGYDTYDYELKFEEIEAYLKMIYKQGFGYHYNEQADGAMRGIIYIYPKQNI